MTAPPRHVLALVLLAALVPAASAAAGPSRPRLMLQVGHSGEVRAASLSRDGTRLLTAGEDGSAILWETESGREVRRFRHGAEILAAALTPDGSRVLTGGRDGATRILDARTGDVIRVLTTPRGRVSAIALTPDGSRAAVAFGSGMVLVDTATGREVRRIGPRRELGITALAFSADGRQLLLSGDCRLTLWDVERDGPVTRLGSGYEPATSVAISPDGTLVASAGGPGHRVATIREVSDGRVVKELELERAAVKAVAFLPDGRLVTGGSDYSVRVWNPESWEATFSGTLFGSVLALDVSPEGDCIAAATSTGLAALIDLPREKVVQAFFGRQNSVRALDISPDGSLLLTGRGSPGANLWDLREGREARRLPQTTEPGGEHGYVEDVDFSPDGRRAVTTNGSDVTEVWDVASGARLHRMRIHPRNRGTTLFTRDGRRVAVRGGVLDPETGRMALESSFGILDLTPDGLRALGSVRVHQADFYAGVLWDLASGKEVVQFAEHPVRIVAGAVSTDGLLVATAGGRGVRISDAVTGGSRYWLDHASPVDTLRFSGDGLRLATGTEDGTAWIWEVSSGEAIVPLEGHVAAVTAVAFSLDGRQVFTGGADGLVIVWDVDTGRELCRLTSFFDGSFAVVDPEGRYDASHGGDVKWLHFVIGEEPVSLDQLKDRYYDPGLLAKHLGFNEEPLREVASLAAPELHPRVRVDRPDRESNVFRIRLENRGGGIGRVTVLLNGKEVRADARAPGLDPEAARAELEVDLTGDPRLRPGQENRIEILAYNRAGYLRSRGLGLEFEAPEGEALHPPELWAVVAGVTDYAGDKLDLRFAARDAVAFASALKLAGRGLFGEDRVHVALLAGGGEGRRPTRANLVAALADATRSRATDVLVLYLAGHGVNQGGEFHFLTAEATSADLTDPEVRSRVSIQSRELTELVKSIPALRQVLILDTCAAGALIEELTAKRSVASSQVRALERVKDRTGLHILAGCAADRVSYEATRYAQGLLTYSLLFGMRGAALRDEEFVDVARLFGYVADRVPQLARDIGGIQRPLLAVPRGGGSFDLGRLTPADREAIPLANVRPLVLRTAFQEEESLFDELDLGARVDGALREESSRRDAPLVFVDARRFPDAHLVSGRYVLEGDSVVVNVRVRAPGRPAVGFTVEGEKSDPEGLARRIVVGVLERL